MVTAVLAGMGVAHPPPVRQDDLWNGFFAGHFGGVERELAKRIFANSGVVTRHGVANPLVENVTGWSTKARMDRYLSEALPLGKEAVATALYDAGVRAEDIGLFVVCSCTGYATPGLDILLARDFRMAPEIRRLFVGHMGCYAALPGLGAAADYVTAQRRPALVLCVELTSLHVQPPTADPQQIVAHALFSDAAAAVVLTPGGPGYAVRDLVALTDAATPDHMTWHVTDLGFRMGLSPEVPDVLATKVAPFADGLLGQHGLGHSDVDGWAVHPGGPRILDVVQQQLRLTDDDLTVSRNCLAEHGNCSSPTVLMIVDVLRQAGHKRLLSMAFGPGLTLYAALLERV